MGTLAQSVYCRSGGEGMDTRRRGFWRWLDNPKRQRQFRAIALAAIAVLLFYLFRGWQR